MATFPVVRGKRLRATRTDICGMPIAGPRSRLVTSGFVTLKASPVWKDANDLTQENADGLTCVTDRTPAQLKWWSVAIELCGVDTDLYELLLDWEVVTGWDGEAIGVSDQKDVLSSRGVGIELWSGTGSQDTCPEPTSDDVLTNSAETVPYGYLLWPVLTETQIGDEEIGAKTSTFTLTGITKYAPRWGRGPYNVMPTDSDGTPGRLLTPMKATQQYRMFRTFTPPPDVTTGACPLVLPSPYYGDTAVDVADEQPACDAVASNSKQTVTISGTPTGGTFALTFKGQTASGIAYNAANTVVRAALEGLSTIGTGNVTVTGSGPYVVEFVADLAGLAEPTMTAVGSFSGGTSPSIAVANTQTGGVYS